MVQVHVYERARKMRPSGGSLGLSTTNVFTALEALGPNVTAAVKVPHPSPPLPCGDKPVAYHNIPSSLLGVHLCTTSKLDSGFPSPPHPSLVACIDGLPCWVLITCCVTAQGFQTRTRGEALFHFSPLRPAAGQKYIAALNGAIVLLYVCAVAFQRQLARWVM